MKCLRCKNETTMHVRRYNDVVRCCWEEEVHWWWWVGKLRCLAGAALSSAGREMQERSPIALSLCDEHAMGKARCRE